MNKKTTALSTSSVAALVAILFLLILWLRGDD